MTYPKIFHSFLCSFVLLFQLAGIAQAPTASNSHKVLLHSTSRYFVARHSVTTKDNGTAIAGKWGDTEDGSDLLVMKLDAQSRVVWARKIVTGRQLDEYRVAEMNDGSIVVAASSYYEPGPASSNILMVKLTCKGDIVYSKDLTMKEGISKRSPYLFSLKNGRDNDVLISFYNNESANRYTVICRINASGSLVWSKTWRGSNTLKAVCFYDGVSVVALCYKEAANYGSYPKNIVAMKLNYETGASEQLKGFVFDEIFTNYGIHLTHPTIHYYAESLLDGSYAIYGMFERYDKQTGYFYTINLGKDFSIGSSNIYTVPQTLSQKFAKIRVFPNGQTHFIENNYEYQRSYWSAIADDGSTIREKKMNYPDMYVHHQYVVIPDNGVGAKCISSIMKNRLGSIEIIHAEKNDASIEQCIGPDTSFIKHLPLQIHNNSESWGNIKQNETLLLELSLSSEPVDVTNEYICPPASFPPAGQPSTLTILGEDTICTGSLTKTFTARSQNQTAVSWYMSPDDYSQLNKLNDSTVSITFKGPASNPVQVKLIASAGTCEVVTDTLPITLLPGPLSLPGDLDPCALPLQLQPGDWFKTYVWQDGSTEAMFEIKQPGIYHVTMQSYCGDKFTDTVIVSSASTNIPAKLSICKKDTVTIAAADGFQYYNWQPGYNLQTLTANKVNVYPEKDTFYILRATSTSGCEIADTVFIQVDEARAIALGTDKSLCTGETLELNAGQGYVNYNWNTGQTTQYVTVTTAGLYHVSAFDDKGCQSSDSISITIIPCDNDVDVPTAFTPNRDGKNDYFKPSVRGIVNDYQFSVYNRWGEMLFNTDQLNTGWTGEYKGVKQPGDAYVWLLQYRPLNGDRVHKKGTVVLIR